MLLQVENLNAHYGKSHILHGVSFAMEEPSIVSLLGRNGSGRSTTLKAMMGWLPPTRGSVRLRERSGQRAGSMSGGEQQMLTICRSLLGNPLVLLVDEPTEGLAPKIVDVVTEVIRDIQKRVVGVLLVEQKMSMALKVAQRVLVMGHGEIVFDGTAQDIQQRHDVRREWLEVA